MSGHPKTRNRDAVYLMAQVAGAAAGRYVVRNLSASGACIAVEGGLEKGAALTVSMGRLDNIAAEVAWARGGLAGIRFLKPINVATARQRKRASVGADVQAGWVGARHDPYRR